MDTEGTFRITYPQRILDKDTMLYSTNLVTLDFGSVTDIRPTITKAVSTIPLVSMGADRAFQLETGNTKEYSISFSRLNPNPWDDESEDSTQWSNSKWYAEVTKLVDRWQMKTDGCSMTYVPSITNPYVPQVNANGYIKMLTRKYNNKFNELITGTIQFVVGTMYVLSSPTQQTIEQKKYKLIILEPTDSNDNTFKNNLKRYGAKRTFCILEDGTSSMTAPETPPAWRTFAAEMKYKLTGWKVSGGETRAVNNPINVSGDSNKVTMYAQWASES